MARNLRIVFLLVSFLTGCFRWAPAHSLDEAVGASRVRVEVANAPPVILDHPTTAELRQLVVEQHARLKVKKVNAWAVALVATGSFLMSAFTAFLALGAAAAGIAGG